MCLSFLVHKKLYIYTCSNVSQLMHDKTTATLWTKKQSNQSNLFYLATKVILVFYISSTLTTQKQSHHLNGLVNKRVYTYLREIYSTIIKKYI